MIHQPTMLSRTVVPLVICLCFAPKFAIQAVEISASERNYFEKHVRPLLTRRCLEVPFGEKRRSWRQPAARPSRRMDARR